MLENKPGPSNYKKRQIEHKNKTGDVCSSDEEEDPSVSDYHVSDSDSVDTAQDEDSLDDDYSDMDIIVSDESEEEEVEEEFQYEVLTADKIFENMEQCIKEVNDVIERPPTLVKILLNKFKWDTKKLLEQYFCDSDNEMFKQPQPQPQLSLPQQQSTDGDDLNSSVEGRIFVDCEICYLSFMDDELFSLECNHRFCADCWCSYLTTKIMDDGDSQSIYCPDSRCKLIVDESTVKQHCKDNVVLKYKKLVTNNFVQCNRLINWCPGPGCTNAIKVQRVDACGVKCSNGHEFCFTCLENNHEPIKCTLVKKWIKKCKDDSETFNWISINTKECPKCSAIIEKNGGCNHMTCRNAGCKHEFCWLCFHSYAHQNYAKHECNSFGKKDVKESRAMLEKYLFYYNRYVNHEQSLKFEHKLEVMVTNKMEEMQKNMGWVEVQFLEKSLRILLECRRTLMYTYVFAYYLKRDEENNQPAIFEANQSDLESATEELSHYLERDLSNQDHKDIKEKVLNKYRYCDSRRKKLLDYIQEGYQENWWHFED